ncbi:MAG TPA: 3-isopropylmalate dehydratase large subunit [Polyangiaceae bacterium]|nr:3-isopropylmalate dehydratase large subunit [Polyangiaceae bacterium]
MGRSLFDKVWDRHTVGELPDGRTQLFIGLHYVHEVTSPQAFAMLDDLGLGVRMPERTVATVDHVVPTDLPMRRREGARRLPFSDAVAEGMTAALESAAKRFGIRLLAAGSETAGVVHVVGPELGLTQPGMTLACGDSHTSTHGAFGSIAFGIGTTQVRDVLATQTLAARRLAVRRIVVDGSLGPGVYAKDVILHVIRSLGTSAGAGCAYEFAGSTVDTLSMEERMTLCNMAIEGGARVGYCNPDETTFAFLRGRPHAPAREAWDGAVDYWRSMASDGDASYDGVARFDAARIAPTVTWGITPGQAIAVDERIPYPDEGQTVADRSVIREALEYMKLDPGAPIAGTPVQVAFIGSCTNGRLSDLREVARYLSGHRVARGVRALVVPGSMSVARAAEAEGIDAVFRDAGFEWRSPGCSMCLGMNDDRLVGDQTCASASNRNFKGRQGSSTGRTLLMSPVMVAAAAIAGAVTDARDVFDMRPRSNPDAS